VCSTLHTASSKGAGVGWAEFKRMQDPHSRQLLTPCWLHCCCPADKFVELHGDRAGLDDPAIVCGIGSMDGKSFMFIGHQKGRNTKVGQQQIAAVHLPSLVSSARHWLQHSVSITRHPAACAADLLATTPGHNPLALWFSTYSSHIPCF
jgi:hypothetical protein